MSHEMSAMLRYSEAELLERAQQNDEAAVSEIMRRYSKLVKYICNHFFLPGGEREDLEQEAFIGLHEAIRSFNPRHNTSFYSFAKKCIRWHLINAVKAANRKKHEVLNNSSSLDQPAQDSEMRNSVENLPCSGSNPEEIILEIETETRLYDKLTEAFSPLEKKVFELRINRLSYAAIAEKLGISVKAVDNAIHRIRIKTRRVFKDILREEESDTCRGV